MRKRTKSLICMAFIFLCISFQGQLHADSTYKNNDEIVPEVIKSVSPSVVGVIGNLKDSEAYSGTSFSEEIAHGTGLIIRSNGLILTNAHVVKDMDKIVVVLSDGTGYEAKLQCIDEATDIATIKIEKSGLQAAKFGNKESIIIGKTVIAIGTPISFSLRNSASIGIISGINRGIDSLYRLIQTDAAINPGNSGGPLVNLNGEVVGINSSKFMGTGIEGMGFSIPITTVKYVIDQFDKYKAVKRPYLGVEFEEAWAAKVGLPSKDGLKIIGIKEAISAQSQGLRADDVIISINNTAINSIVDYNEEMMKYVPQNVISVKIKRDNAIQTLKVKLAAENN